MAADGRGPAGYLSWMSEPIATTIALHVALSEMEKVVDHSISGAIAAFRRVRGDRAVRALVDALAELDGLPRDEAAKKLDDLLTSGEPGVRDPHEVLYETFRSLAFTRTEAAWPYIAKLTASYLPGTYREQKPVDDYFRRMGRLLERCEQRDIVALRKVAEATLTQASAANAPKAGNYAWVDRGNGIMEVGFQSAPAPASVPVTLATLYDGGDLINLVEDARLGISSGMMLVLPIEGRFTEPFLRHMAIEFIKPPGS